MDQNALLEEYRVSKQFERDLNNIQRVNGNYDFEKFGIGRYILTVGLQDILGINLNGPKFKDERYRFLRKKIANQRKEDFDNCLGSLMSQIMYQKFNQNIPDFHLTSKYLHEAEKRYNLNITKQPEYLARVESQLLEQIIVSHSINSAKRNLEKETKDTIEKIRKTLKKDNSISPPIRVAYFQGNSLEEMFGVNLKSNHVYAISLGSKTYESITLKLLERIRKIYHPTSDEMKKYTSRNANKTPSKRELSDFYEQWIAYHLDLDKDFVSSMLEEFPTKSPINSEEFNDNFGKGVNELFGDTFILDSARAKIIMANQEEIESLNGIITRNIPHSGLLSVFPHKNEFNPRDKSYSYCVTTTNDPSQACEIKLMTAKNFLEGEFGSKEIKAHYSMRPSQIRLIKKELHNGSHRLEKTLENLCTLFKLTPEKLGLN